MLDRYASPEWRERYLERLVQSEVSPSFAMTEPAVASSDPTQLQTTAELDGDEWVISGRKWFTTGANRAAYTTVMCRTEDDSVSPYLAFSTWIHRCSGLVIGAYPRKVPFLLRRWRFSTPPAVATKGHLQSESLPEPQHGPRDLR